MRSSLPVLDHLASPMAVVVIIAVVAISAASWTNNQAGSVERGRAVRQWAIRSGAPSAQEDRLPEDNDLLKLERTESITALQLQDSNVSDVGMDVLVRTPRLWILDLSNTRVTGKSLSKTSSLQGLEYLLLSDLDVHDDDLVHLKQLPLLGLSLAGTQVRDAGLDHLTGLRHLSWLDLAGTKISDAGVRRLASLQELTLLDLEGTDVSNSIVEFLLGIPNLQHVTLKDTRVTQDAVDALRTACPKLWVTYE